MLFIAPRFSSLGYPVVNDPLYNHPVFGPLRGKGGDMGGKTDEQLVRDLIAIHNAENWLGVDAADDDMLFSKPAADDKGNLKTFCIIVWYRNGWLQMSTLLKRSSYEYNALL